MGHLKVSSRKQAISVALVNLDSDFILLEGKLLEIRVVLQIQLRLLLHSRLLLGIVESPCVISTDESRDINVAFNYRVSI